MNFAIKMNHIKRLLTCSQNICGRFEVNLVFHDKKELSAETLLKKNFQFFNISIFIAHLVLYSELGCALIRYL